MATRPLTWTLIRYGLFLLSAAIVFGIIWSAYRFTQPQAAVALLEPPAAYDHEPSQPYTVAVIDDHMELVKRCRMGFHAHLIGCALPRTDEIYIIGGLSAEDFDAVLRHEKAHLNGWRH